VRRQRQIRFDEERKRLLYVACTRARRELHLFGTAVTKPTGVCPAHNDSLLATAWPALHPTFESAQPLTVPPRIVPFPMPGILEDMAAEAADPAPSPRPCRLVLSAEPVPTEANVTVTGSIALSQPDAPEFQRPEGSRQARLIGSAVHTLLQRLGPQLATLPAEQLRAHAASLLRASALSGDSLRSATDTVTNLLRECAADPVCRWILAPHPEAQSEASWTGFVPGDSGSRLRSLRADRIFRAGPQPLSLGSDCLWIIDYKTGPVTSGALFLTAERELYAPQLRAYARALRALHGPATQLRLGLYYPAAATLDYWDPDRE
jgi:ATP-dependent exoDNAse (exonuclease V) beta subunit